MLCKMTDLLLPPSCNWFQHNGVSCRSSDNLFVTACFRNIAAYHLKEEASLPILSQFLPHQPGKVCGIAIYPDSSHPEFGNTLGVIGDQSTLSLANLSTGSYLAHHQVQKTALQSLCWGHVNGEEIIAAVGSDGTLIVWQPKYLVARSYSVSKKNLTVVEVLPNDRSQALIASDKSILLVSLKQGEILSAFKGHDYPIFCIRWYPGTESPLSNDDLHVNTRWKKDDDNITTKNNLKEENGIGPYFASSDLGRNIFVWDLSLKRYIVKTVAPFSAAAKKSNFYGRDKNGKHHITLNWVGSTLYSSTVVGEVLAWSLFCNGAKHKILHHSHTRAIFNMEVMNTIILTFSQDRTFYAYDIANNKCFFQVQTLGSCANSMAFSPHDAHRLALGLQEGAIRLLTISGSQNVKAQNIHDGIKEKVLCLSWHPSKEGILMFGTSDGQVGLTDIYSGKSSTYSYFHQKATYKVEWAPPLNPQETDLHESWYAYSFGGREIVIRNPENFLEKPLCINSILNLELKGDNSFAVSEFSFTPDYEYLAVGSLDGVIKIFERTTAKLKVSILRVRKTIQHLLWKPPASSDFPYFLAIGSAEASIYLFNLDEVLKDVKVSEDPVTITQPLQELSAHTARVVWLAWSPHKDGILASASYDHTVQIWNTITGEPLANYSGHNHRVFRVEFSPHDPDLMISFAEENCVHQWRPSRITDRTPKESSQSSKKVKPKFASEENSVCGNESSKKVKPKFASEENSECGNDESTQKSKMSDVALTSNEIGGSSSASAASKKAATLKAFFPLFHTVASRKKSFLHMCILSAMELYKMKQTQEFNGIGTNGVSNEDELFDDDLNDHSAAEQVLSQIEPAESIVKQAISKYGAFMPSDQPIPDVQDICQYINFFGNISDLDELVCKEIQNHKQKENFLNANMMHCWQGSLESQIKWAAKHKQLDAFLVSIAPQVSFSLWECACEAYAEQLADAGQPATAATYLLSIRKDEEAIDLLLRHKLFREALTVAKYRMCFNTEVLNKVVAAWTTISVFEGNFELGTALQLSIGNIEHGARLMARRTESGSLIVAAKLYEAASKPELAYSTGTLALKEASLKHEFEKIDVIMQHMPQLSWYKCISICHEVLLHQIKQFYDEESGCALSPFPESSTQFEDLPPLLRIIAVWNKEGILPEQYSDHYKKILAEFATQNMPSTLKQLWYQIAKSLTVLLLGQLSGVSDFQFTYFMNEEILKYVRFWGKNDQIFYVTHTFLCNDYDDSSTLGLNLKDSYSFLTHLQLEYVISELKEILQNLECSESYTPWIESDGTLPHIKCMENSENSCSIPVNSCDNSIDNSALTVAEKSSDNQCDIVEKIIDLNINDSNFKANINSELSSNYSNSEINLDASNNQSQNAIIINTPKMLPMYPDKESFIKNFETFIRILNSLKDTTETSLSNKENFKVDLLSQIIVKLCERSAISESTLRNLLSKVNPNK